MKKIFTILAAFALFSIAKVQAQQTVDLELVQINSPLDSVNMPNFNVGDSILISVDVKNNGTANVNISDTIFIAIVGPGVAEDTLQNYILQFTQSSTIILPGATQTFSFYIKQGDNYGDAGNGPVITNFPSNTISNYTIFVFGHDALGQAYNDAGYDATQSGTNAIDAQGNNYKTTNVIWGNPVYTTADLELSSILSPADGSTIPNMNNGDSLLFSVLVKNNGPGSVNAGDQIRLSMSGKGVATDGVDDYILYSTFTDVGLAAGATDTISVYIKQGQNYGNSSNGPVITNFPSNSVDTIVLFVYGINAAALDYIDAGYDPTQSNLDVLLPGSNNTKTTIFNFGTNTTGIQDISKSNTALTLYPNPAKEKLNISYIFQQNINAAIRIIDIMGREVMYHNLGQKAAGEHQLSVDINSLAPGIYTVEMLAENQTIAGGKLTVAK